RVLVDAAEALDPLCRLQVEADPRVRAALAVVAEEDALELVLVEQPLEVAQVGAELLGRDRSVLEGGPGLELAGDAARADRGLADEPHELLLARVLDQLGHGTVVPELPLELARLRCGLLGRV